MLLALLACWSPDPTLAPTLPPAEGDPVEDAPDEPVAVDGVAPDEPPEEPPPPEPPEATPFDEYVAYTTASPVSIVDEQGRPLAIIAKVGTPLEVQTEEEIRTRVYCATCSPPAEGWVQKTVVTARGEHAPKQATTVPPGAPPQRFLPSP